MTYGLLIYLNNFSRPYYSVYIQQQRNGTWTEETEEIHPISNSHTLSRPLETERKYTVSNHGSWYIYLSLDLGKIGFPAKYEVDSYVMSSPLTLQQGYTLSVPITHDILCAFSCIVPSWPFIQVFPGRTSSISIPIKSNDYVGVFFQDEVNHGMKLSFSPNTIELPITGSNRTFLQITTPSNIASNNYTLYLNETLSTYKLGYGKFVSSNIVPTSFSIGVLKPLDSYEQISQFLTTNIEYTVIILLGTTLGLAIPLLLYVWKKGGQYIFMELGKTDILQINATIMVGVLILLTLGTLRHLTPTIIGLITASIIFPFAVSSIMVIISKEVSIEDKVKSTQLYPNVGKVNLKLFPASIMAMIVGFEYVIVAVITLAFVG